SILLSESTAKAFFGDADPINQVMKINNKSIVKIAGVYEDLPLNTQFKDLKFVGAFDLWLDNNPWIRERAMTDWQNHFLKIYAEIAPNTTFEQVSHNIKDAELKNLGNLKEQAKQNPQVFMLPMSDWHLHNYKRGEPDTGPLQMLWIISIIGGFVLLLACINFMNLSTARSEKRAAEVGIRKAIGSARLQLISQFFSESLLVALLAFMIALVLVLLAMPVLNDLSAKQITVPFANIGFWLACLGFILFTGLLAGIYPAFYLSSFPPVKVFKGAFRAGRM